MSDARTNAYDAVSTSRENVETGASRTVRNPFSKAPANRSRPTGSEGAGASAVSKERVNGPEERGSSASCRFACASLAWGAGRAGAAEGAGVVLSLPRSGGWGLRGALGRLRLRPAQLAL